MVRAFSLAFAVLCLAACSSGGDADGKAGGSAAGIAGQVGETAPESVPCALAGGREFTKQCGLDRAEVDGKTVITLRHPDGGFRRLIVLDGAKRYAAADGSDEVVIEANGAEIEVTLGDDHYLLPGAKPADAAKR